MPISSRNIYMCMCVFLDEDDEEGVRRVMTHRKAADYSGRM